MKRFISILLFFSVSMCLLSCSYKGTYEDGYGDGYDDGHYEGLCAGYDKGIEKAKEYLAFVVDDDLSELSRDIEDKYGIHPEKAVQILTNYADDPDSVSKEDLLRAIYAIDNYFNKSHQVINGIEDYWID